MVPGAFCIPPQAVIHAQRTRVGVSKRSPQLRFHTPVRAYFIHGHARVIH